MKKDILFKNFNQLKTLLKPVKVDNPEQFIAVKGFSIDSRSIKKGEGFIAIKGKHHDGHKFIASAIRRGASCIISQKQIRPLPEIPVFVVKDTYCALEKVVHHIRKVKNPFVYAITGSVGKTITKEMLSFLLEGRFKVLKNEKTENNILGVAKTILSLKNQEVVVLELGTNAPGEIKRLAQMCVPDVGIITFIKPVHLEKLKSLKGIRAEKAALLKSNPKMRAILNGDDPLLKKVNHNKHTYWFGRAKTNDLWAQTLGLGHRNCQFIIKNKFKLTLHIPFDGFIYNALAAMLAARQAKISLKELTAKMSRFKKFPSLRMELRQKKGFGVLNDAYNANPYSLEETLKTVKRYPQKKIAVIADMLELGKKTVYYHEAVAPHIIKSGFEYVLTLGKYAFYLHKRLKKLGHKGAFHFSSKKEVAKFINDKLHKGKAKKQKGWLIFLKGSRKMELEKITDLLA